MFFPNKKHIKMMYYTCTYNCFRQKSYFGTFDLEIDFSTLVDDLELLKITGKNSQEWILKSKLYRNEVSHLFLPLFFEKIIFSDIYTMTFTLKVTQGHQRSLPRWFRT